MPGFLSVQGDEPSVSAEPTPFEATRTETFNAALERGFASVRSEEHTSELQSHSFISYAVFCLKKKNLFLSSFFSFSF